MNIFSITYTGNKGKRKEIIDLTMVSPLSLPLPPCSSIHQFASSNHSSLSNEMKIDNIGRPSSPTQFPSTQASNNERSSLTYEEFDYTINLLNKKIDSIYHLCRFLGDQMQEQTKSIKKLVAIDELSEKFWKVLIFDYFQSQKSICKIY